MGKLKSFLSSARRLILSHKKVSFPLIIALIAFLFFLFPKNSKSVLTETVSYKDVVKSVSVTGNVDSDNVANLTFQFGGKLIYVGVKPGDTVKKGQAIVSLDQNQLQASFRQAQQDFIAAKAASDQYYDGNKTTAESYAQKVTRTALDAAQNKAYDQMMKVQQDLNNSTLYAPFDGIVTKMDAQQVGLNVITTTTFTITDPSTLNFKMEVDEADIGNIRDGQKVDVSLDAFPDKMLHLSVDKIDFVSHTTSSGGNAYYVKAGLPQDDNYRVGMGGNADIIISSKKHVLSIQSSDIDNNYVYVEKNNKFQKRKVQIGLESDTEAEVLSGLNEGDIVALDPTTIPQNQIIK